MLKVRRVLHPALAGTTIAIVALASFLGTFGASHVLAGVMNSSDFAPFAMRVTTWRSAALFGAEHQGSWELRYTNRRDWVAVVVSDSVMPDMVGSWRSFKDNLSTSYAAKFNSTRTFSVEDHAAVIPDEFLSPRKIDSLLSRGWTIVRQSSTHGTLQIAERPVGVAYEVRTVLEYDLTSRLPVLVQVWHEGTLVQQMSYALLPR